MATFNCANCNIIKTVPDEHIGKKAICPKCKTSVVIKPQKTKNKPKNERSLKKTKKSDVIEKNYPDEMTLRIIDCMLIIACSDGNIDDTEVQLIHSISKELIKNEDILGLILDERLAKTKELIQNNEDVYEIIENHSNALSESLDNNQKQAILKIMEELIWADNSLTKDELNLFNIIQDKIDVKYSDTIKKKKDNHEGYNDVLIIIGLSLFSLPLVLFNLISIEFSLLLIAAAVAYSIWDKFIRRRCSKCKSKRNTLDDEQELDRWLGRKTVSEKTASGKNRTKNVQTTFVKVKRFYHCNDCRHEWAEISKEEK